MMLVNPEFKKFLNSTDLPYASALRSGADLIFTFEDINNSTIVFTTYGNLPFFTNNNFIYTDYYDTIYENEFLMGFKLFGYSFKFEGLY